MEDNMEILLSDDNLISQIKKYPYPNWIWIDIWEISEYEAQVVVIVNEEEMCHLAQHKVIHTCSAKTDEVDDIMELKKYGKRITRLIRKKFSDSEVHSRLYL